MASHSTSPDLEYDFVQTPSEDYFCPVTYEILKDPQQTNSCCGNHISRAAADLLKREGKPCPMCKIAPLQTTDDLFFKRQVLALKVRCSNKALGCDWVGELGKVEQHLKAGSLEGECQYVVVVCPNECGEAAIERGFLQRHLHQHCPLQEVECKFSYAGCGMKTQRSKMQEHMDQNKDQHLEVLAESVRDIRIQFQALMIQFQALSLAVSELMPRPKFIAPPEIVLYDFEQSKNNKIIFYSPSFYSHIGGYKMCLRIQPNGWGSGEGTHVGVSLVMMRGEFDNHLQWPFRGEVKVQLINQRDGGEHMERKVVVGNDIATTDLTKYISRVLEGERAECGLGLSQFISHSDLYRPEEGKEYLKNDSLKFNVPHVALLEN